jgi:hypothetical protein
LAIPDSRASNNWKEWNKKENNCGLLSSSRRVRYNTSARKRAVALFEGEKRTVV